jgi:hypothetical protein
MFDSWYLGEEPRSTSSIVTASADVLVQATFAREDSSLVVRSIDTDPRTGFSENTFVELSEAMSRRDSGKKGKTKKLGRREKEAIEEYCRLFEAACKWLKTQWQDCDEEMPSRFRGGHQLKYHVIILMYKYYQDKMTGRRSGPPMKYEGSTWTPDRAELKWILQQAAETDLRPADVGRQELILWISAYFAWRNRIAKAQRNAAAQGLDYSPEDEEDSRGFRITGRVNM